MRAQHTPSRSRSRRVPGLVPKRRGSGARTLTASQTVRARRVAKLTAAGREKFGAALASFKERAQTALRNRQELRLKERAQEAGLFRPWTRHEPVNQTYDSSWAPVEASLRTVYDSDPRPVNDAELAQLVQEPPDVPPKRQHDMPSWGQRYSSKSTSATQPSALAATGHLHGWDDAARIEDGLEKSRGDLEAHKTDADKSEGDSCTATLDGDKGADKSADQKITSDKKAADASATASTSSSEHEREASRAACDEEDSDDKHEQSTPSDVKGKKATRVPVNDASAPASPEADADTRTAGLSSGTGTQRSVDAQAPAGEDNEPEYIHNPFEDED